MEVILIKVFSFVFIIIIGYVLKKLKVFGVIDYKIVIKIIMNIIFLCVFIIGFVNFKMDMLMLFIVLLGFLCNIIMLFIGYVLV